MDKKALIQWYKDNNIIDIVDESTCNHFELHKKKLNTGEIKVQENNSQKAIITIQNRIKVEVGDKKIQAEKTVQFIEDKKDINFNYIYQNLANKYRNDNMKIIQEITPNDAINKARDLANNANSIEELKNIVENFDGYLEIKKLANNTVFGEGNTESDILILGEAPGNNEDLEGRPFCGQSGELLNNMFRSIGLLRNDLYITNTLFWRPPGNRTPTEEELSICKPFVEKHIALINPKLIVCMGATALTSLIDTSITITKARRQLFDYTNQYLDGKIIKTIPLFHPSYLLRQSSKKKDTWGDLLFIKKTLKEI